MVLQYNMQLFIVWLPYSKREHILQTSTSPLIIFSAHCANRMFAAFATT